MARTRPPDTRRRATVVAAARRIDLSDPRKAARELGKRQDWQEEAIAFANVTEVKFVNIWAGNLMAKVRLFAGAVPPGSPPDANPVPVSDPASGVSPALAKAAEAKVAALRSEIGGQGEILSRYKRNVTLVGECYLVGWGEREARGPGIGETVGTEGSPAEFRIYSIKEIVKRGEGDGPDSGTFVLDGPDDRVGRKLEADKGDQIIRMWLPDPMWWRLADCNMRGLLDDCRILQGLHQQAYAETLSRMNAGILFLPNGLEVVPNHPGQALEDGGEEVDRDDSLMAHLEEAISGPIEDISHPSGQTPVMVRGEAEDIDHVKHLLLARTSDASLDSRIDKRIERIARGLDAPVEVVLGHASTTFCVDDSTEALTADGWRCHDEIEPGTLVLTLDHETGLASWQAVSAVNRFEVEDEPVLHIERKSHSSMTTGGHRWPVILADRGIRTWRTTAGRYHTRLNTNHRLTTAAPVVDLPSDPKWSDDWVELIAWFYTEGSVDRRGRLNGAGKTIITQSKKASPENVVRIRNVLHRLAGDPVATLQGTKDRVAWREYHDPNVANVRFMLSAKFTELLEANAPDRVPTIEFVRTLTPGQLELFILVSGLADGWTVNSGTRMFSQKNPRMVDAYEMAVILSGRTPSRWSGTWEGTGTLKGRYFTQHLCSITDRTTVKAMSSDSRLSERDHAGFTEWTTYTGTVWCPTTPNGTWMARRNGSVYFTGNSNATQIDQDTFEDHIEPGLLSFYDMTTVGYLRPELEKDGFDHEQVERVQMWGDASALIASPDTEKNAATAHGLNIINDSAARKALGFSDDDAPDALELVTRIGAKRGILTAELTDALLAQLAQEAGIEWPDAADLVPGQGGATSDQQAMAAVARLLTMRDRKRNEQRAQALSAAARRQRDNPGERLAAIDTHLRTVLVVAASDHLTRALDKAGARMRTKSNGMRNTLRDVPNRRVAVTLGRTAALAAASTDEALAGAWDDLGDQWESWVSDAQAAALGIVADTVPLSQAQQDAIAAQQERDRTSAWDWLTAALTALAVGRMFDPSVDAPDAGEFDPSLAVPPGLVRQAVARAGGDEGLVTRGADGAWVALADSGRSPAGGVGTGVLMTNTLRDGGALIEGYRWVYGGVARKNPFIPHMRLDGVPFRNFDDDVLASDGTFGFAFWLPGDHEGCICVAVPEILVASDLG